LALLASVGGALVHDATATHRTCEHGGIVDVDATARAFPSEEFELDEAHLVASTSLPDEGTHLHCLSAAHRTRSATVRVAHAIEPAAVQAIGSTALADAPIPLARERRLLLAPKSSPPA
jgi:hypothetical protein